MKEFYLRKGKVLPTILVLIIVGVVGSVLFYSCKNAKVVEKPLDENAASINETSAKSVMPGPHPEVAAGAPEVQRQNENILVVYRHTGPGYAEAYGFDTFIFRIFTDGSGLISGGTSYQRTLTGEKEAVHFNVSTSGSTITLAASDADNRSWSDRIALAQGKAEISGTHPMMVSLDTALTFASLDGSYVERFSVDPASSDFFQKLQKEGRCLKKVHGPSQRMVKQFMCRVSQKIPKTLRAFR